MRTAVATPGTRFWAGYLAGRRRLRSFAQGGIPNAPTWYDIGFPGPNQLILIWEDNATNEANFELWRNEDGGPFLLQVVLPPNTGHFSDNNVLDGRWYGYRVRACNRNGCSDFSSDLVVSPNNP